MNCGEKMEKILKYENIKLEIEEEQVLTTLNCTKDNPTYDQVKMEFDVVKEQVEQIIDPKCLLKVTTMNVEGKKEKQVLIGVGTIGEGVENLSKGYFKEGAYLKGMLVNTIADYCVFALEEWLQERIANEMQERGYHIKRRMEFPKDFQRDTQEFLVKELDATKTLGITLTSAGMMEPAKSFSYVYLLRKSYGCKANQGTTHHCESCNLKRCSYRKI